MKKIVLIHTVKSVNDTFADHIISQLDDVEIYNILDDFLAIDANARGEFTLENANRLFFLIKAAELSHADVIVATCSTLTPWVEKSRPFVTTPVVAIDDAMTRMAVSLGSKITIMATAQSTVEPTRKKLLHDAAEAGVNPKISIVVCEAAFRAMKANDMVTHDRILREAAHDIKDQDAVVLAQASMAHLEPDVQSICGCKTLSSPNLCIAQVKKILFPKG